MRVVTGLIAALLAVPTPAMAQEAPPSAQAAAREALSQCLVLKSTGDDRRKLVRWILGGLGSSSLAQGMLTMNPAAKDQADQDVAVVFTRLVTADCLPEMRTLVKSGDNEGVKLAFNTFGQLAMHDMTVDHSVDAAMGAFVRYLPESEMKKISQ